MRASEMGGSSNKLAATKLWRLLKPLPQILLLLHALASSCSLHDDSRGHLFASTLLTSSLSYTKNRAFPTTVRCSFHSNRTCTYPESYQVLKAPKVE